MVEMFKLRCTAPIQLVGIAPCLFLFYLSSISYLKHLEVIISHVWRLLGK